MPSHHHSSSNSAAPKDLPYMTTQELEDFIDSTDIELSKEEIEYLYLRRRRLSVGMKKNQSSSNNKIEKHPIIAEYPGTCENSYPFKVMILGDESYSGKIDIFQLFTLTDLIESAPHILDMKQLPPCDIQTKLLESVDPKDSNLKKYYALELWLPQCTEETTALRPLYYPATDIFVLIFSIKEPETFNYLAKMIIPEMKKYMQQQDNSSGDIPILLVGNHAEVRNDENYEGQMVPSQEAFNLAQEAGISKYIEIFSENLFHIHEIFQQSVLVVDSAHAQQKMSEKERAQQFYREYQFFKSQLTIPAPDCNFSQLDKTFELATNPGVEYFYTTDGTDPTKGSKRYKGAIQLKKPYPKEIRAIAIARCKYQSEVSVFKVPAQSSSPVGYFDPITKGFHIQRKSDTVYFITLDGSNPTTESMVYKPPGIFFDNKRINCAFERAPRIPEVVKVIAIEEGKFGSKVVSFKPFNVLPAPSATLKDNVLRIDTIPGVVYRYTIDGTTPSFDSPEFTHSEGVLISSEKDIGSVKIAAFPKLFFPSSVKTIKNQKTRSPKPTKQIRMNRATMRRNDRSPARQRTGSSLNNSLNNGNSYHNTSNGSGNMGHYASSTISSANRRRSPAKLSRSSSGRLSTGGASPRASSPRPQQRAASPKVRPQRGLKSSITKKEQQSYINRKALFQQLSPRVTTPPPQRKSHQFKVNTAFSTSSSEHKDSLVECKAEGTNIEFNFAKPVLLSNVIVKTPGQGDGPSSYECFSIDEDSAEITTIAAGELKDEYGEQVMEIDSNYTQMPCTKVLCVFEMRPGQSAFKILDMKVDCKVK